MVRKVGGQVYISFSGGKDSTVLLDLARRIYPDIEAVYVDTGLEYPEIKTFVKSKENVMIIRPEMSFRQVLDKYGYPVSTKDMAQKLEAYRNGAEWAKKYIEGTAMYKEKTSSYCLSKRLYMLKEAPFKITCKCCNVMKKTPCKKYEKKTGKHPIVATMATESRQRRNSWLKTGCNAFGGSKPISQPMSFWTEQDVLQYLKEFEIPYCSVYGDIIQDGKGKYITTGCSRTGCVFCGFGCHLEKEPNRFQRLKQTHPKLWEYCMKDWDKGGLGMKNVLKYINVKIE